MMNYWHLKLDYKENKIIRYKPLRCNTVNIIPITFYTRFPTGKSMISFRDANIPSLTSQSAQPEL